MQTSLDQGKENQGSTSSSKLAELIGSPCGKGAGSPRKPLTPLQRKLEKGQGNGKDGRGSSSALIKKIDISGLEGRGKATPTSSPLRCSKTGSGLSIKQQEAVKKDDKTDGSDVDLITGDDAPLEYWQQLAEQRRVALEDTLKENRKLAEKVEALEAENRQLEEMLEEAKTLAEMVNALSDGFADDSGIVGDATFNSTTD